MTYCDVEYIRNIDKNNKLENHTDFEIDELIIVAQSIVDAHLRHAYDENLPIAVKMATAYIVINIAVKLMDTTSSNKIKSYSMHSYNLTYSDNSKDESSLTPTIIDMLAPYINYNADIMEI